MLQAGGMLMVGMILLHTTSQVLGRLKARVRGKDPMLFRILSTEFLLLEQIY